MIALVRKNGAVCVEDRPVRPRPPGEARIRMRLAGVCSTDLEIARGYMGFEGVLGHEFVGDVIEADDPRLVGRRVVGGINAACERCESCARSRFNHCPNRTVLGILGRDGTFAESFLLPERNLVTVPDTVADEHAVFAEPLAAALRILEQVDVEPCDRVAVLGDGRLGILCALVLADRAHSVVLFGHHPGRVLLPVNVESRDVPREPDRSFELVVEATGSPEGLATALSLVVPTGTVVLKTTCAEPHAMSLAPLVIDEVTLVGSRCGPIEKAVEKIANGVLPLSRLIDARFPLERADQALARAGEKGVLKVLIEGKSA